MNMKIPLVDLEAQYKVLRDEMLPEIDKALSRADLIGGKSVENFEQRFAEYCGVPYAVGVANGTDALWLGLWALGVEEGDEVIIPAQSFVATSEAVRLLKAKPVFVDIEESSFNISPKLVIEKITPRTKVILPVHLYGRPANLTALQKIANEADVHLFGDAAQAHGASHQAMPISSYGKGSSFSFYPGKNLGAYGDAGALATADKDFADLVRSLRDHGRREKYLHTLNGTNSRLDALQAVVLNIKLKYLHRWCERRREIASYYHQQLKHLQAIKLPELFITPDVHAMHLYVIRVSAEHRDSLLKNLHEKGIGAGIHYPIPLHLQPCNHDLGFKEGSFPVSESIAKEIISLPLYPELSTKQLDFVCQTIEQYIQAKH